MSDPMKLFKVSFMNGGRTAYVKARTIAEAVSKLSKALKIDSVYDASERRICGVLVLGDETWPNIFGG